MKDFDVNQIESKVLTSTNVGANGATIFNLDGNYKWSSTQNYNQYYIVRGVAINSVEII